MKTELVGGPLGPTKILAPAIGYVTRDEMLSEGRRRQRAACLLALRVKKWIIVASYPNLSRTVC